MASKRTLVLAAAAVFGIPLLGCCGLFASIGLSFPPHQGPRVDGGELVGIDAEGSYVWIVPTQTGVVLIDSGFDAQAAAVKAEIGEKTVHAVFITHGHGDHVNGLAAFPNVPVYAGPGETPLVRGEALGKGLMQQTIGRLMVSENPGVQVTELTHEHQIEIDGTSFTALHTPGHTGGSLMFLWKDVLFSGDSLLGHGDEVAPVHWAFADDSAQNEASLARLEAVSFARLADGHAGLHDGAKEQLLARLR